jgi:MoaA/NifB/PqqE/SkfB family radical SAM enzyme
METLSKLTCQKLASFYITEGELLLHPRITEIFDIAKEYFPEIPISFITNGLLLLKMLEMFWEN